MSADAAAPPIHETSSSAGPAPAPDPGNPAVLGVPCAVIGVASLGLFLFGYAPNGSAGAVVPLFLALGVGLFIAGRWAIGAGVAPLGGIFGVFGGFFWSFALLYTGFVNDWFGTHPTSMTETASAAALTDTFSVFTLAWAVGGVVLVLATLRLPLAVWLVLLFSELVFVFVFLAFITGTFADGGILRVLAGVSCVGAVLAGGWVFYVAMSSSTGGPEISLGPALVG
jgi:uncharacterized protein